MNITTKASVPDELAQAWLQHLRDFDTAHPGCHFEVLAEAPDSTTDMIADMLMSISPALPIRMIFKRDDEEQ